MIAVPPFVEFLGGLVVIVLGAEILLRSATRMAAMLGVSPIVIGLTIVSVGTSAPELAVGITAVAEGKGTLAVGNIAGTNIVNILLILGLSAAILELPIRMLSVKLDVPVMIGSAVALALMSLDGVLTQTEGALLLLAAVLYTALLVRESRRESSAVKREFAQDFGAKTGTAARRPMDFIWRSLLLLAGMALTVLGANLLVAGAINLAMNYGVSDAFIGLTIVAIGTSAPELATTLMATFRNDRDVAIGNLIGSSIYNILVILGLAMLAAPSGIDVGRDVLWIDLPLAAVAAVVCLPVFRSGGKVSRKEGVAFVVTYLLYLTTLVTLRT
jgi:cation:H+ antiporter